MTLVIAHRGASKDHEENTIEAFIGAAEQGAHWVEFDVRRTSDGHLVIHHDAALPDGRFIADTVRSELPRSVPTLESTFAACGGMGANVEIKNSPGEPGHDPSGGLAADVAAAIARATHPDGVMVTCFDLPTLDAFREVAPEVDTGYLVLAADHPLDAVEVAVERGHVAVNPLVDFVDRGLIERARSKGIAINAWTTDDPVRIRELAGWGIDGIITNVPAIALAALADSSPEFT